MEKRLRNRVVFISGETSMREVIQIMRDRNISSVLVTDRQDLVAGIITERDIVQKFSLLEVPDKLDAKAFAVMNRPIKMARISHLYEDILELFKIHGFRHFPVTSGTEKKRDVIGIMTVTDIAHSWLTAKVRQESPRETRPVIIVVAAAEVAVRNYHVLFSSMGFDPEVSGDPRTRLEHAMHRHLPILLDIDGMNVETAKEYLLLVKHHDSVLLLLSSEPKLVEPLKQHLQGPLVSVSLKPLDISQILRLLEEVHKPKGASTIGSVGRVG